MSLTSPSFPSKFSNDIAQGTQVYCPPVAAARTAQHPLRWVQHSCCQIIIYISINQSIYVSIYLRICLSIYLSNYLSIYLSTYFLLLMSFLHYKPVSVWLHTEMFSPAFKTGLQYHLIRRCITFAVHIVIE